MNEVLTITILMIGLVEITDWLFKNVYGQFETDYIC